MATIAYRPTRVLGIKPKPCFTLHTTHVNIFTVQEKSTACFYQSLCYAVTAIFFVIHRTLVLALYTHLLHSILFYL